MKQRLFIFLFLTGFIPFILSVPRKYYLIQQGKTWDDAQAYCRATYNDLAIIESNDNLVQLQDEAQRQHFSSSAWIGLYNAVNSWRWSMGNVSLGSMIDWCSEEPNNHYGKQSCGGIIPYCWDDMDCTDDNPTVCYDGTKTGNERYIYISNLMSWSEAQAYCRTHYTDMASARNQTENSIIMGLTSDWTWFGLFRDTWKWTDQTNFNNSPISWMPGKPDNALGNENCGYLNNGDVVDAQCSDIMPFYCYSDVVITGKRQVVKVKVRSNQDVNDPAAKETILEQIKQKLKDHGIVEDTTVKWREQPDGVVFHKEKENA